MAERTAKILDRTFPLRTNLVSLSAFTLAILAEIARSAANEDRVLVQPHRDGYYVILESSEYRALGRYQVQTLHATYGEALAAALTFVAGGR